MTYRVVLQHSEEGYRVSVPGLPGCFAQGETEGEAFRNIQSAITDYVEVAASLADPSEFRTVEVAS